MSAGREDVQPLLRSRKSHEVTGNFTHRGAAMQEARFVIDAIAPGANYKHRVMGYKNDPRTTFADIQQVLDPLEQNIERRLRDQEANPKLTTASPALAPITKTDIEIVKHAAEILDSPAKWDRASTQDCPAGARTLGLYCALRAAAIEVSGTFDDQGAAISEVRRTIRETAPTAKTYQARLVDFNNDPATSFEDIQKLLRLVEERLSKRLAQQPSN
jgi:hypothetical protein